MKRKLSILLTGLLITLGLTGCGSASTSGNTAKVYGPGETAYMTDTSGKQIYSLTINSVTVSSDYLSKEVNKGDFADTNKKQVLKVDYTYNNIAKDDDKQLIIYGSDLKLADETGTIAQAAMSYPDLMPQQTPVGMKCNVQAYYGLANVSKKVKISFVSETYKSTLTFEIPVTN